MTMMDWNSLLSTARARQSKTKAARGRSVFDFDYDRVLFSSPVRRLQDKAQVFPLEPNDAVRTRLTHSMEVSTVARSMACQAFARILNDSSIPDSLKPTQEQVRDIEVIAATCGLIHDLGNPPFGHSGESAIASWFEKRKAVLNCLDKHYRADFLKFEGNAQTLRLISHLQVQADRYGLNFTNATLSASLKYVASAIEADDQSPEKERTKPGYFVSESTDVERFRSATGTGVARNPITYLVEAADDAVYSACDIEDAIRKAILKPERAIELVCDKLEDQVSQDRLKGRIETLTGSQENRERGLAATAFRIAVHGEIIPQLIEAFVAQYPSIMQGNYHGALEDQSPLLQACKKVGQTEVYGSGSNPELELLGRRVLHDLMDLLWEGIESAERTTKTKTFPQKIMSMISHNYVNYMWGSIEERKHPELYCRLQLMTDFVCGMTDSYARDMHRRLFNG